MDSSDLPLGKRTSFPASYDPTVLASVPRSSARMQLGLRPGDTLPFCGEDLWHAWEFCWLDQARVLHVDRLSLRVPFSSHSIVESKSLKLYLHGYSRSSFLNDAAVVARVSDDLSALVGVRVEVELTSLEQVVKQGIALPGGGSLDRLQVPIPDTEADARLLAVQSGPVIRQHWHTDLFSSLCPVTGQPDWATIVIELEGRPIAPASVAAYLLSYRDHGGFHETCAEQIYLDLWSVGEPQFLSVECRYTRRGGIDISPYRASASGYRPQGRLVRQ